MIPSGSGAKREYKDNRTTTDGIWRWLRQNQRRYLRVFLRRRYSELLRLFSAQRQYEVDGQLPVLNIGLDLIHLVYGLTVRGLDSGLDTRIPTKPYCQLFSALFSLSVIQYPYFPTTVFF